MARLGESAENILGKRYFKRVMQAGKWSYIDIMYHLRSVRSMHGLFESSGNVSDDLDKAALYPVGLFLVKSYMAALSERRGV